MLRHTFPLTKLWHTIVDMLWVTGRTHTSVRAGPRRSKLTGSPVYGATKRTGRVRVIKGLHAIISCGKMGVDRRCKAEDMVKEVRL